MKTWMMLPLVWLALAGLAFSQTSARDAVVAYAVDGDTAVLEDGTVVHYVGVQAPDRPGRVRAGEPFGSEAYELNKKMVAGKQVRLEFDVESRTPSGELMAYVHVGKYFVNATLIQSGYARAYVKSPNTRFAALFEQLQAEARDGKRGLWRLPRPEVKTYGNTDLDKSIEEAPGSVTNEDLTPYDIPGEDESMAEAADAAAIRMGLKEPESEDDESEESEGAEEELP